MSTTTSSARLTPDRLRHSLLSQGGAQFFKLVVAFGIGAWMARYLGPQDLGTLSYAAALVGILGPLGNLGVKSSLSTLLCEESPLPGLLGSALLIELFGTLVVAVVLIPFAWMARDPVVLGLIALALLGNLLSSSEVFEVELLNRERGTQLARVGTIQTVANAFLSVLALLAEAPLLVFGGLPVLQAAIRAWLLAVAAHSAKPLQLLRQASWKTSSALVQRGWPVLLSGLSVMLYMKSDQVMLEWLRGPEDVGLYSVAVRVAESLYFLPVLLSSTFFPRIGRGTGQFASDTELRQLYRIAWIMGVAMTVVSMFVLAPLIPIVFGNQFLPAKTALIWLGPASFSVATGCASGAWLMSQGQEKLIAQRSLIGALTNILLNIWLIPSAGLVGAALATSISYFVSVYLVGIIRRKVLLNLICLAYPF